MCTAGPRYAESPRRSRIFRTPLLWALLGMLMLGGRAAHGQALVSIPGSPFDLTPGGANTQVVRCSPNGKWLYAPDGNSNAVNVASLDSSGTPTYVGSYPTSLSFPCGVAVSSGGNFVYVTGVFSMSVSVMQVNQQTGALTEIQTVALPSGGTFVEDGIAYVNRSGSSYVYVYEEQYNAGNSFIDAYSVGGNGMLTYLASYDTKGSDVGFYGYFGSPRLVARNNRLFSLQEGTSTISVFNIAADGSLTAVNGSPFAFPASARSSGSMAMDAFGSYLVAGTVDDSIVRFSVSGQTGALTLVGSFPTGMVPNGNNGINGLAIDNSTKQILASDPSPVGTVAGAIAVLDATNMLPVTGSPVDSDDPTNFFIAGITINTTVHRVYTGCANPATWHVSVYRFAGLGVSITPSSVIGGDPTTATISLGANANSNTTVTLTSSDPSVAQIQSSVVIPTGQKSVDVPITTNVVTAPATVTITADDITETASATLKVLPFIDSVQFLDPNSGFWVPALTVIGSAQVAARVNLSLPSTDAFGTVLYLGSTDTKVATAMPSITIQNGQTTAYFPVFTNPVANTESVFITAIGSRGGMQFGTLTVHAPVPTSMSIMPTNVTGGTNAAGTININGPAPAGGLVIPLVSSADPPAHVPTTVTVQPGKYFANFPITTATVTKATTATITGTYENVSASASVTVTGTGIQSLVFNPASVVGGQTTKGIVTLSKAAPAGGATITLSKTDGNPPAVGTLPTVTIPAGQTSALFTVSTNAVTSQKVVPIQASYNGASVSTNLTVTPAGVSSVTILPSVLHSNTTATGRVFLQTPAPPGGALVTLSATAGGTVPATVLVPAGATVATFTFRAGQVQGSTLVVVTASYNTSATATVMVIP